MASGPITSWQIDGETMEIVRDFIFWGSKITADGDCSHEIKRCLLLGRKVMTHLESILKNRDITLPTKLWSSQSYGFSSCHVWMWELDYKESWAPNNWCFWIAVLEKNPESPFDCKKIQPVHPKGDQSWVFIGRTDAEAETPSIPCHLMQRTDSLEKTPMLGKIEGGRRRATENEMVGGHHQLEWWTGVWVSSGSWWWTGKPGALQPTGSQRVGHDWETELIFVYTLRSWTHCPTTHKQRRRC